MNENIDLTKILKNCPKGTKLYTSIWGQVVFVEVVESGDSLYPILILDSINNYIYLTKDGHYLLNRKDTECIIFPSKEQRDWSKFTAPWYKKDKFDPNTLKPFDKVLIRECDGDIWRCSIFSHMWKDNLPYVCNGICYKCCIPYNDETKHLVGTTDEAPEYYRNWES